MKLFFVDDSNITKEENFGLFIYGGLIIDESNIRDLIKDFLKIKQAHNIDFSIELKWDNVNNLDPTRAKTLKDGILKLVQKSTCKIIIYLAPQNFYHKKTIRKNKNGRFSKCIIDNEKYIKALKYATNICSQKFNQYLANLNERGLILSDETNSCKKEMRKYCSSIYPDGTNFSPLANIAYVIIPIDSGYSQMHQINDIVIGAIQYSLKEFKYNFLPLFKNNFWSKKISGKNLIMASGYGFNVYPKRAKTVETQKLITRASEKFKRLINKKP